MNILPTPLSSLESSEDSMMVVTILAGRDRDHQQVVDVVESAELVYALSRALERRPGLRTRSKNGRPHLHVVRDEPDSATSA